VSVAVRFAGRLGAALVFATAAAAPVIALAVTTRPVALTALEWLRFLIALIAGSIPLALLGVALGYWIPAKGALPAANLVYLAVAYAGGLWTGPHGLPRAVERAAPLLPTRQWGDILWSAVLGRGWGWSHWLALLGFTLAFGVVAACGYRRDEGQRFR
jgi:ABC-2 type transport system permease protein